MSLVDQHEPRPAPGEPNEMLAQLQRRLHVWIAEPPRAASAAWIAANEPLLSAEERARHRRFVRAADRGLFLASHALVRKTLSRYSDIPPGDWTFRRGRHGRPEIANRGSPRGLRFSLSRTSGMVAVMVHVDVDAGVDVERLGRVGSMASVAMTAFTQAERDELFVLSRDEQEVRFYGLWTLKEAFVKAKERGLSLPLQDFSIAWSEDASIRLVCRASIDLEPSAWRFTVLRPSPRHVLATACRSGGGQPSREVELLRVTLR